LVIYIFLNSINTTFVVDLIFSLIAIVTVKSVTFQTSKSILTRDVPKLAAQQAEDPEELTKKFGLEFGLFKAFTTKDNNGNKVRPQDLLAKYGAAYLVTSISFAIVSYTICFLLVSKGVDVAALLESVGIKANSASSTAGTAGIAYAVHKAASPLRFPPTVALTPVVANYFGGLGKKDDQNES